MELIKSVDMGDGQIFCKLIKNGGGACHKLCGERKRAYRKSTILQDFNSKLHPDRLDFRGDRDNSDCGEVKRIVEVGYLEKGTGKHQSNIVYSIKGIAPTLTASLGVKQSGVMILVVEE